jgi:amyloid beta precursor protein binding protein 1
LENSKFCLLTGDAVGSETLKNLVLPGTNQKKWMYFQQFFAFSFFLSIGIGQFTIIDDAKVDESDLGNNFFVERDSIGKNRSEEGFFLLLILFFFSFTYSKLFFFSSVSHKIITRIKS